MMGALGDVGDLAGIGKKQEEVPLESKPEEIMSVDSKFTMGDDDPDWLFSPNKIRNFVAFGMILYKKEQEEEEYWR